MAVRPPFSRQSPVGPMYRIDLYTGTLASGTTGGLVGTMSSALFTMQWASTKRIFMLTTMEMDMMWAVGTMGTASPMAFGCYFVRGYSTVASGTTLATFGTGAYVTQALDTLAGGGYGSVPIYSEFATAGSAVGAIYAAGTALLTAGVGTIDRFPMHSWMGAPTAQTTGCTPQNNVPWMIGSDPNTTAVTCRYNEGLTIQPMFALGSGSYIIHVGMEWIEMPINQY